MAEVHVGKYERIGGPGPGTIAMRGTVGVVRSLASAATRLFATAVISREVPGAAFGSKVLPMEALPVDIRPHVDTATTWQTTHPGALGAKPRVVIDPQSEVAIEPPAEGYTIYSLSEVLPTPREVFARDVQAALRPFRRTDTSVTTPSSEDAQSSSPPRWQPAKVFRQRTA